MRQLPAQDLVMLTEKPAIQLFVETAGEKIELEFIFSWQNKNHSAIRITGHARGPSTWHQHQHLQESILITLPISASNGA
jgi:hypothetical protein